MRAVWLTKHGGLDALEVRETPDPEPKPGEVRVKTEAVGLNYAEIMARRGTYPDAPKPPCVLGYEGAGTVDKVGDGVDPTLPGTRVVYMSRFWGQSSSVCVPADYVVPLPDNITSEAAAALPVNYVTAFHMLFQVRRLQPGDRVLVHMAAGGVGTAVLQMCREVEGVTTFGTAAPDTFDFIKEQGCNHPINYLEQDYVDEVQRITSGEGIDLVLDPLGGLEHWNKGYSLLRPGGQLIVFGLAMVAKGGRRAIVQLLRAMKKDPPFTPLTMLDDNRGVSGVNIGHLWDHAALVHRHGRRILDLYNKGRIKPHIGSRYPFSGIGEAHDELESGRNVGKIVLYPD